MWTGKTFDPIQKLMRNFFDLLHRLVAGPGAAGSDTEIRARRLPRLREFVHTLRVTHQDENRSGTLVNT